MSEVSEYEITSMNVGIDPPKIQQAFTTIAAPIIAAEACLKHFGTEEAKRVFGGDDGELPKAGEVVIGRMGFLVCKLVIEPESGGYAGGYLCHEEIQAIAINEMTVGGKKIKRKAKGKQ